MAKLCLNNSVKFKELLHHSKIPRPYLTGLLDTLWGAAHSSGNPVLGTPDSVEIASEWPGAPGEWFTLLQAGKWIEQTPNGAWRIKDYFDHCPDYVIKRIARERSCEYKGLRQILMEEYRIKTESVGKQRNRKTKVVIPAESDGIRRNPTEENGSLPRPDQTKPNQTSLDQTRPDKPKPAAPQSPESLLATEWLFYHKGPKTKATALPAVTEVMAELLKRTPIDQIEAWIKSPERSKIQPIWEFEKRWSANVNGRHAPTTDGIDEGIRRLKLMQNGVEDGP